MSKTYLSDSQTRLIVDSDEVDCLEDAEILPFAILMLIICVRNRNDDHLGIELKQQDVRSFNPLI